MKPNVTKKRGNERFSLFLSLFFTMLKIGTFTFGGGYTMLALLEEELVVRHGWMTRDEFLDLAAIAESTPGPIAVNGATYIGYKVGGVAGSVLATLGVVLPSFFIIFFISLFFDAFLSLRYVAYAFRGIQVCVLYLIGSAGVRMFRAMEKSPFSLVIFGLTFFLMLAFTLCAVSFSTVFYILIGGALGVFVYALSRLRRRGQGGQAK